MKNNKLFFTLLLVAALSARTTAAIINFNMVWGFTADMSGSNGAWSRTDVCSGGTVYIKNQSTYSLTNGSQLSGYYVVWNAVGNSNGFPIDTITVAQWPVNGVYALHINSYFNYSNGLNIRITHYGPMGTTYANNGLGKNRMCYLTTRSHPAVNAGLDQSVCLGGSVQLTGSGATSYTWTPGGTQNPIQITPSSAATYTLTGSATYATDPASMVNGITCYNTDVVNITVLPLPSVKGWVNNYSLCTGATLPLLDAYAGTGSYTYQWSWIPVGGSYTPISATTSNLNTAAFGYGYFTVLITNTVTGCSRTFSANVVQDPSSYIFLNADFAPNPVSSTANNTVSISPVPVSTAGTHLWKVYRTDATFNTILQTLGTFTSTTFNLTMSPMDSYYRIDHTISKSPCNETKTQRVSIHYDQFGKLISTPVEADGGGAAGRMVGSLEADDAEVAVYPNPTKGMFTVKLAGNGPGAIAEVYEMNGRLVKTAQLGADENTIDISGQPKGIYIIRIIEGNQVSVKRILLAGE